MQHSIASSTSTTTTCATTSRRYNGEVLIPIDFSKGPREQQLPLHNRWHPEIPPVASVEDGSSFVVECYDCLGGQIKNNDDARDLATCQLSEVHYLSGPIEVKGAQPGDLLQVEILDLGALKPWGFTGILAPELGGGFLCDDYPVSAKAIWDIEGVWASSRHIPGVKFTGITHPGLMGTAPSRELLEQWNRREKKLFDTDPNRVPPLALLPSEHGALVGLLEGTQRGEEIKKEAARTIPPREHGGNCDIKVWYNMIRESGREEEQKEREQRSPCWG